MQAPSKRYLTLGELAARWNYKPAAMRNAASRGTLPIPVLRLMPKGEPRFSLDDIERHEKQAAGEPSCR